MQGGVGERREGTRRGSGGTLSPGLGFLRPPRPWGPGQFSKDCTPQVLLFVSVQQILYLLSTQHFFHASQVTDIGCVFVPTAQVIGRDDLSHVTDEQNKEKG